MDNHGEPWIFVVVNEGYSCLTHEYARLTWRIMLRTCGRGSPFMFVGVGANVFFSYFAEVVLQLGRPSHKHTNVDCKYPSWFVVVNMPSLIVCLNVKLLSMAPMCNCLINGINCQGGVLPKISLQSSMLNSGGNSCLSDDGGNMCVNTQKMYMNVWWCMHL